MWILREVIKVKAWLKIVLAIVIVAAFGYAAFTYTTLNGNPIKKMNLTEEAQSYLNKKYDKKMVVEEGTYNLNIGYGATAHPKENPNLTFQLYRHSDGDWSDQYPREVWSQQLKNDIKPILNEQFSNGAIKITPSFDSEVTYKGKVPKYTEITGYSFMAKVQREVNLTSATKQQEFSKIFNIVTSFQDQSLQGGIKVVYKDNEIRISKDEMNSINTITDVKDYVQPLPTGV